MQVLQGAISIYMQGVVCMVMMVYFLEMDGQMLDFISTLRHSCRPEYRHELTHKDNPKNTCFYIGMTNDQRQSGPFELPTNWQLFQ